ncbi:MAG TPA: dipicolinate synthase subunit B [Candidatus Limivicinus faecipullorum]|nr:dipicolinate synthase subunit B [Candidatus Limivicinus faecipullorum]
MSIESKKRLGLALCGSYCTFEKLFAAAEKLSDKYELIPIMSENAAETDTRFGAASEHIKKLMLLSGKKVVTTIAEAEPLGPATPMDALLIAPCTGNTLAKLANGITDTSVTMAAKAHMRNGRPVIIALSTNDGLSGSAENIAKLLNRKGVYFVPFRQDDPAKKPRSLQADFSLLDETVQAALRGWQIQPILK